jgi:hypothetical protein
MNESGKVDADKLVEIHKAQDPWQGHLLIGFLRENGMEAAYQGLPAIALDAHGLMADNDAAVGVFVLERDVPRARELVKVFLTQATDTAALEAAAARPPHSPDRERIAELRGELQEERRTFELLGWLGAGLMVILAVLWTAWPDLFEVVPVPLFRYIGAALIVLAAVFAGNLIGRRMRK